MRPQLPQVAELRDGRAGRERRTGIGRIGDCLGGGRIEDEVDLGGLEAGQLEFEVELEPDEFGQLEGERLAVPTGILGQPVVGEAEGAQALRREMIDSDDRQAWQAEIFGGQPAAMACHHGVVGGGDDRHEEAERAQAGSDLRDLLVGVLSQLAGVSAQTVGGDEFDRLGEEGT